jgi:4-amino-4-deoxy-L-arabinose transferase-like glycosyltransferase
VTPLKWWNFAQLQKWGILLVLALALFLRLQFILTFEFEPVEHDQKNYTTMAIQLLERGVYAYNDTKPNALVTPGFPVFLALVFKLAGYQPIEHAHRVVRVVQAFISLGAIWFIYLIGLRLFNRGAGLLAALFAAVYGPFVMVTSSILTEILFLTCFMGLIYFQVRIIQENRISDHIWAGVLLGLSVLIRPNSIIVAVTPYLFLWAQHRKLFFRQMLWGVSAFAVVMLPWWARNFATFHEFVFIAKGEAGNPFLGGTDPYGKVPIDWGRIRPDDQMKEGLRRIREGLNEDPALWIRWFTFGKLSAMFKNSIYWWPYPASIPEWYAAVLRGLHYVLVYAGMAFAAVASFVNLSVCFLSLNFLLFLGIHLLFIPEPRYSIGMFPFLMLITSYLVTKLFDARFLAVRHPTK